PDSTGEGNHRELFEKLDTAQEARQVRRSESGAEVEEPVDPGDAGAGEDGCAYGGPGAEQGFGGHGVVVVGGRGGPSDRADDQHEHRDDEDEGQYRADRVGEVADVADGVEVREDGHGRSAPGGDGEVDVVVVASGDGGGVMHASAVVGEPAFVGAGVDPDQALPDDVVDPEIVGVDDEPVGDLPAEVEGGAGGGFADGVAEGAVAGSAAGVVGVGSGAWCPAEPVGVGEGGLGLFQGVAGAGGDLPGGGRVIDHRVGIGAG